MHRLATSALGAAETLEQQALMHKTVVKVKTFTNVPWDLGRIIGPGRSDMSYCPDPAFERFTCVKVPP
jgi:hypothetical protein